MPIKRKIVKIGGSNAVFIPKSWLDMIEQEYGYVEYVTIDVNGHLTIKPILPKRVQC